MLSLYTLSAKAQVFVTPTLTDQFLANVTTSVLGTPAACPDDVTLNCDMLSDANANPIKGIAWDEGTRSNQGHLYFEDGQGNSVFLQLSKAGNTSGTTAVYPNPATDKIFLSNMSGNYAIYTMTGIKALEGKVISGEHIDVAVLSSGVYFIKAEGKTYKFTKQ